MNKITIIIAWVFYIYLLILMPIAGGLKGQGLIDAWVIAYMFGVLCVLGVLGFIILIGYMLFIVTKDTWND